MGLAAAALLATNPLHIAFSQEARSYALAVMLVIAAHLFFLRSLGEPSARNRIVYALLVAAAVYTHYFALLAVLPHGLIALWLLLTGDEDSRRAARPTLLAFGCGMATFIAWLPALAVQITGKAMPLEYLAIQGSPLVRAVSYMEKVVGLGAPPFLLLAAAALLVLLVSAFLWQKRLPAAVEPGSGDFPPRKFGVLLLVAGLLLAAGLRFAAPRYLLPAARQILLAAGLRPRRRRAGVARPPAVHGVGPPGLGRDRPPGARLALALVAAGPVAPGRPPAGAGPWRSTFCWRLCCWFPSPWPWRSRSEGTPLLSPRNLLICEPALALALALGAVRLAQIAAGAPRPRTARPLSRAREVPVSTRVRDLRRSRHSRWGSRPAPGAIWSASWTGGTERISRW